MENGEIYQSKWYNTGDDPQTQVLADPAVTADRVPRAQGDPRDPLGLAPDAPLLAAWLNWTGRAAAGTQIGRAHV